MYNLNCRNLTMMTDLYELTMMYGYFMNDKMDVEGIFDLYFRQSVGESIFGVAAGLEQAIEYIQNLHFTEGDIEYLKSLELFNEPFFEYLRTFQFTGEIYAMPEGTVTFPFEPLLRVRAPLIQAQFIETALLNIINHQTLIATKASRVAHAAEGDAILEFGLRRAQGPDAGNYGARAAIIGGCESTSNVLAGQMHHVRISGTHAHSWVMSFETELEAFRAYANTFPNNCLLLVDTYDTLKSGVPNAITVFQELSEKGYKPVGIRLDSGDLAYLSKQARKMLDEAGFEDTKIFASSDLDEELIRDLKAQGAKIDVWGVGTKLITSDGYAALGGVYKLVAEVADGAIIPKIKLSDNISKTTTPGYKKVYRMYSKKTDKALADLITLEDEEIDNSAPLTIFSPTEPWKKTTLKDFYSKELLVPVFIDGRLVYETPSVLEIQAYAKTEINSFWEEHKRIKNPHSYKVDLSQKLFDLKQALIGNGNVMLR